MGIHKNTKTHTASNTLVTNRYTHTSRQMEARSNYSTSFQYCLVLVHHKNADSRTDTLGWLSHPVWVYIKTLCSTVGRTNILLGPTHIVWGALRLRSVITLANEIWDQEWPVGFEVKRKNMGTKWKCIHCFPCKVHRHTVQLTPLVLHLCHSLHLHVWAYYGDTETNANVKMFY